MPESSRSLSPNKEKVKNYKLAGAVTTKTTFNSRSATRNFLGQASFLRIRALRKTIIYNTKKKGPAGKNLRFFLLETLKNCTLNEKFYPQMIAIRTRLSNFRKTAVETSPSPRPLSLLVARLNSEWKKEFSFITSVPNDLSL